MPLASLLINIGQSCTQVTMIQHLPKQFMRHKCDQMYSIHKPEMAEVQN